jgi:hypothetical protein
MLFPMGPIDGPIPTSLLFVGKRDVRNPCSVVESMQLRLQNFASSSHNDQSLVYESSFGYLMTRTQLRKLCRVFSGNNTFAGRYRENPPVRL